MTKGLRRRGATLIGIVGCVALPALVSAEPVRLVDTGPSGPVASSVVDWNTQWLAGEFSTSNAWRITSVEGWMLPRGVERFGGPLRISLLNDGGNIPSDPVFSTVTNVPGVGPDGWYGQSGLNWTIPARDILALVRGAFPHEFRHRIFGYLDPHVRHHR